MVRCDRGCESGGKDGEMCREQTAESCVIEVNNRGLALDRYES